MPSGFVDRVKGKIAQSVVVVGGRTLTPADQATETGWGTVPTSTTPSTASGVATLAISRPSGLDVLSPGAIVGGAIYRLSAPFAGCCKSIYYTTLGGSTIVWITASTDGTVVINGIGSTGSTASFAGSGGTTISNTMKSTQSCQISMIGLSSAAWLFTAIVPSTTGHITFSTST